MRINWCKILGHRWIPIYIIGYFGAIKVNFIGAECSRCNKGDDDLRETVSKMNDCHVCSHNEKYYKN